MFPSSRSLPSFWIWLNLSIRHYSSLINFGKIFQKEAFPREESGRTMVADFLLFLSWGRHREVGWRNFILSPVPDIAAHKNSPRLSDCNVSHFHRGGRGWGGGVGWRWGGDPKSSNLCAPHALLASKVRPWRDGAFGQVGCSLVG